MLTESEIAITVALILGDALVIRAYLRPHRNEKGGSGKRYPGRSFRLHVLGGLAGLALGAVAVLAFALNATTLGTVSAYGQGLAVVLFAGIFALPLSRHTSGFQGFNLVGYVLYTLAWIASALMLLWAPGAQTAYACFVLTHAYLTCRIFVWAFQRGWEKLMRRAPDPDANYSVATTFASMIPLVLAWGMAGFLFHLAAASVSIFLHAIGISSRWHATQSVEVTGA